MKARHPRTTKPKRRKEPTAARRRGSSSGDLQKQLDQRTRERDEARKHLSVAQRHLAEALEQQTATSEVLGIISSSPSELEPVFQAMLANATRICEAKFGTMYLFEGDAIRPVALHNAPLAFAKARTRDRLFRPAPDSPVGRLGITKEVVHIADAKALNSYIEGDPSLTEPVDLGGFRTVVAVPMLKANELIGAIAIYRQEVRTFTDKQIALVQNFAKQAVIAIENTRLLNELRESLENQTASADILRAIASSPAKAERALDVIAETTARRFGASNVNIRLLDGNILRYVGSAGPTAERMRALFPEGPPDGQLLDEPRWKPNLSRSPMCSPILNTCSMMSKKSATTEQGLASPSCARAFRLACWHCRARK